MWISFLEWILRIFRVKINLEAKWGHSERLFTLENKNFPDCENKEFKYKRRIWNPFGKTGLAHHEQGGWDMILPEELEKKE